jgi:propanediol dehydratase large subunit
LAGKRLACAPKPSRQIPWTALRAGELVLGVMAASAVILGFGEAETTETIAFMA